jgi:predicted PurR-regulated permease PerM
VLNPRQDNPSLASIDVESPKAQPASGNMDLARISLIVLAVLAVIFALHWAKSILIPLVLGGFISFALNPIVKWLAGRRIPRVLSASILLFGIVGAAGVLTYNLGDETGAMIEQLPEALDRVHRLIQQVRSGQGGIIGDVTEAAEKVEKIAKENNTQGEGEIAAPHIRVKKPGFKLQDYLWWTSRGIIVLLTHFVIITFLVFFLLLSGEFYKRKIAGILGPRFQNKKTTIIILNEIGQQIQRYLLVILLSGIFVGVLTWLAFLWIGLNHAAIWGVVAGILSAVPYIGPAIVFFGTAASGLLQYGTLAMALLVGIISLVITSIQGVLLLPWLTSKTVRINAVAVFIGILLWGWLWGAWGILLATPILIVTKSICQHVAKLRPLAELLGP